MPTPADLVGGLLSFIGDALSASSLRLGIGATLVALGVLLVFLQLVARPVTRWVTSDPGDLASVARAMALAAEAGTDAVFSLGTAGLARSTDALGRLQTLAAMELLGHVARAAARSGVPVRVLVNDPLAAIAAAATLASAHDLTDTRERSSRSRVVVVGEGRGTSAGLVMTARARPAAAFMLGNSREEATLGFEGLRGGSGTALTAGTGEPSQAAAALLAGGGALIGPEIFAAAADLRSDPTERTMAVAANRLILLTVAVIGIGSVLALAGIIEPSGLLVRWGGR